MLPLLTPAPLHPHLEMVPVSEDLRNPQSVPDSAVDWDPPPGALPPPTSHLDYCSSHQCPRPLHSGNAALRA